MRKLLFVFLLVSTAALTSLKAQQVYSGFFDFQFKDDQLLLKVDRLEDEFILITSVASGIGSNDLGIDRGKLGSTRLVQFKKSGSKLFLIESNEDFRAVSDNPKEVKAVEEAFAHSILWAGPILSETQGSYTIDISSFLLGDENNIISTLKEKKQGKYTLDKKRSLINAEQLYAFPKNIELEVYLTFEGDPSGSYIKSVVPTPKSISIKQHFSFVELPDDNYVPRKFHPYAGYFKKNYFDYAVPIDQDIEQRFIHRHRLQKVNPDLDTSEVVEPIIYYVDAGCPEPIKSALMEGAQWWSEAFEAAGFLNAFQVKELPENAHPLDVRYNVIQWVHRSTRGWSYGANVHDPRTGEIIKGHVSLGSLRVRQDFMIGQGILSPYFISIEDNEPLINLSLARLRQLSAHEVGHTLGLAHNFAASVNDRASVMDYPHPYILQDKLGNIQLDSAYDDKIGKWDIQAIKYGYSHFPEGVDEEEELNKILLESKEMGLLFLSDNDARPMGSAHPHAHLWDNGSDPIAELDRLMKLRRNSLFRFGEFTIPQGTPFSELEKKLVPVYLMHRYQVEAVSKLIGGINYNYAVKGFNEVLNQPVDFATQDEALRILLSTLDAEELRIPQKIVDLIPPAAMGYNRNRESFKSHSGMVFDPLMAAEAYTNFVFSLLLHEERLNRIDVFDERLTNYLLTIQKQLFEIKDIPASDQVFERIKQKSFILHLIKLRKNPAIAQQVRASAAFVLKNIKYLLIPDNKKANTAHVVLLQMLIDGSEKEGEIELPAMIQLPPGSPIGCGH